MQSLLKGKIWLGAALVVALSLTATMVSAHDGRVVGQYRFVVGFVEEPAFEGMKNGVDIRVTRIAETHGQSPEDGHDDGHARDLVEAQAPMSVAITAEADPHEGVNVNVVPHGFSFSPESVGLENVPGEGHAHIYVDGEKVGRVYSPWFHLNGVDPGGHTIRVVLNANSHGNYASGGRVIEASTHVTVPAPTEPSNERGDQVAANDHMSLSIDLKPDSVKGANLAVNTDGFAFAGQSVNEAHVPGEGHARVYVNDVSIGRLYGPAIHLGEMAEGMNEVRVTLNSNTRENYTWNGQAVEASATVHVEKGGDGYGEKSQEGRGSHQNEGASRSPGKMKPGETTTAGAAMTWSAATEPAEESPVEGLAGSLRVEVTHVATSVSRVLELRAVPQTPGRYTVDLIPTAAGVYQFRVFGVVEGEQVDETFVSKGGGGNFSDIESAASLQFPEDLPEPRELESAVRGALQTAEAAQDAALGSASGNRDGGSALVIVAIVMGAVGMLSGAGSLLVALRRK